MVSDCRVTCVPKCRKTKREREVLEMSTKENIINMTVLQKVIKNPASIS